MNKVVIVGNGFDLAHGLKTRYCDFIVDYIKNLLTNSLREHNIDNDLISVKFHVGNYTPPPSSTIDRIQTIADLRSNLDIRTDFGLPDFNVPQPIFSISCKSDFVRNLLSQPNPTWVDIETEYVSFPKVRPIKIRGKIKQPLILSSHEKITIYGNTDYCHS